MVKLDDFTVPIKSGLTSQPERPTLSPQRAARLGEELSHLRAARGAAITRLTSA